MEYTRGRFAGPLSAVAASFGTVPTALLLPWLATSLDRLVLWETQFSTAEAGGAPAVGGRHLDAVLAVAAEGGFPPFEAVTGDHRDSYSASSLIRRLIASAVSAVDNATAKPVRCHFIQGDLVLFLHVEGPVCVRTTDSDMRDSCVCPQ